MYTHGRLATVFAIAFAAISVAPAQTPVSLKSPDGALELVIAAVRGQSVEESGGQLAYRVAFRGKPVLDWSNLGLAIQSAPVTMMIFKIVTMMFCAGSRSKNDSRPNSGNPVDRNK